MAPKKIKKPTERVVQNRAAEIAAMANLNENASRLNRFVAWGDEAKHIYGQLKKQKEAKKQPKRSAASQPYISCLTWRFGVALQFALGLHHEQARKGGSIPYIAHLMSVCALVLEAKGDEDQALAGC